MPMVSLREQRALRVILEKIKRDGFPPTVRELDKALGINSRAVTMELIRELEKNGLIVRKKYKARTMKITKKGEKFLGEEKKQFYVPQLGVTSGGPARFAQQHLEKMVPISGDFRRFGKKVFLLKIEGDSMVGAGIRDQDLVIIKSQQSADSGDIVLARHGDETTVKKLIKKGGRIFLMPENKKFKPIKVKSRNFEIQGKVVGVIRKNDG